MRSRSGGTSRATRRAPRHLRRAGRPRCRARTSRPRRPRRAGTTSSGRGSARSGARYSSGAESAVHRAATRGKRSGGRRSPRRAAPRLSASGGRLAASRVDFPGPADRSLDWTTARRRIPTWQHWRRRSRPMRVLVTGGAGFIGANLAIGLAARHPDWQVTALDNLQRRGSELNLPRLRHGRRSFRAWRRPRVGRPDRRRGRSTRSSSAPRSRPFWQGSTAAGSTA